MTITQDAYFNGNKIYFADGIHTSFIAGKVGIVKLEGFNETNQTTKKFSLDEHFGYAEWREDVNPKIIYWDAVNNTLYNLKVDSSDTSLLPATPLTAGTIDTYFDKIAGGGSGSGSGGGSGTALTVASTTLTGTLTPAQATGLADNTIHQNATTGEAWIKAGGTTVKVEGSATKDSYQIDAFNFETGTVTAGDSFTNVDDGDPILVKIPTGYTTATLEFAELHMHNGSAVNTATTIKIVGGTTDFATFTIPASQASPFTLSATIVTATIPDNTELKVNASQSLPAVSLHIPFIIKFS